MSNLDGLITALLAVEVVAFGLVLCLVAGGKTGRARGLIIILLVITIFSDLPAQLLVRNYYAVLMTQAIFWLAFLICLAGMIFSTWLEWVSPPPSSVWQNPDYRFKSLIVATILPICTVALAVIGLPKITDYVLDLADGPTRGTGIVENTPHIGGRFVSTFVVRGVTYETRDETLVRKAYISVGKAIDFAYGSNSKTAFLPESTTFEPVSAVIPLIILVIDCVLIYFCTRIFPRSRISQPLRQTSNPSQHVVEALITHFSSEQQTISRSDWILTLIALGSVAVILIVLFFGLIPH